MQDLGRCTRGSRCARYRRAPWWLLVWCMLAAAALASPSAAPRPDAQASGPVHAAIGASEVLEDVSASMDLADVSLSKAWQPTQDSVLNPGFSRSVWWVRLHLVNPTAQHRDLFLDLGTLLVDDLEVHLVRGEAPAAKVLTSGDRRPFHTRPVALRSPAIPLTLAAGEQAVVYVRLATHDGLHESVQPRLFTPAELAERSQDDGLVMGVFFGALFAMALYNFFLWVSTRQAAMGWYVAYLVAFLAMTLTLQGLTFQYLLPDWPTLNNQFLLIAGALCYVCVGTFAIVSLETRTRVPRWLHRSLQLATAASGLTLLPALAGAYRLTFALSIAPAFALVVLLSAAGGMAWRAGLRSARYFVLAFLALFASVLIYYLAMLGVLPTNAWTENSLLLGAVVQMLLLSFGLADRMNTLKVQKLEAERQALAAQTAMNNRLEAQVAERTVQLEEANRRLADLAVTDPLTGAFNRRHFDSMFRAAVEQHSRQGLAVALCLLDVDNFKRYNDQYGHPAGDHVLRELTRTARQHLRRQGDALFRVGGEEFGMMLALDDGATPESVWQYVEAVRQSIASLKIAHDGNPPGVVTASFGLLLLLDPSVRETADHLYTLADEQLYEAKRAGRNRVVMRTL